MATLQAHRQSNASKPASGQSERHVGFQPTNQIQRTFYSPERARFQSNLNAGKFQYGSPSRQQTQQANPVDTDFMSKFGQGGGGAPLRDHQGNIIVSRRPQEGEAALRQSYSQQDIKQKQMQNYGAELQMQIEEQRLKKLADKNKIQQEDIAHEARIQEEINLINQREQQQIQKERGPAAANQFKKFNEQQKQLQHNLKQPENSSQPEIYKAVSPIQNNLGGARYSQPENPSQIRYASVQIQKQMAPTSIESHSQPTAALMYSKEGAFLQLISRDRALDQANEEMKRIQDKLQKQLEFLKSESVRQKAQNEQISQEVHKMITDQAMQRMTVLPMKIAKSDARDIRQQWVEVLHADTSGRAGMGGKPHRHPISFPQAKVNFQQTAGNVLRTSGTSIPLKPSTGGMPLKVDTSYVHMDQFASAAHHAQRQAQSRVHADVLIETAQDQQFVTEFLKEINDIEDINSRFQVNMQQKTNETFMKFTPQVPTHTGHSNDQSYYEQFEYRALQQHLQDQDQVSFRVDENARGNFEQQQHDSEVKGDSTFITTEPKGVRSVRLKYNDSAVKVNMVDQENFNYASLGIQQVQQKDNHASEESQKKAFFITDDYDN